MKLADIVVMQEVDEYRKRGFTEIRTKWIYYKYLGILNKAEIREAFMRLEKEGVVYRVGKGRYALIPANEPYSASRNSSTTVEGR